MARTVLVGLVLFGLVSSIAAAEQSHQTTADIPRSSDFDFLLGSWDLTITSSLSGLPPNMRGRWTATSVADGLMVADEYRVFDDKGATAYLGMTYRVFNPALKQWDIRYVEPMNGKWYEATGWRDQATMRVQQKGNSQSQDVLLRFQYYEITANHFLWRAERSDDGGKTWSLYGLKIDATRSPAAQRPMELSPEADQPRNETYRKLTPVLVVESIEKVLPLWEALGFQRTVEVPHQERLGFVILRSGGVEVMYQSRDSLKNDQPKALKGPSPLGAGSVFIEVGSLSEVARRVPRGTDVVVSRRTTSYGSTEMILRDPAGNVIVFAQMTDRSSAEKTSTENYGRAQSGSPAAEAERRLAAAKAKLMSADYRADLAELQRVREEVIPLTEDPAWGYLAHYWAGYASWRVALNGANHGMSREDLKLNLVRAATDFEASIRLRNEFADSYAAAASVHGWLGTFFRNDPAAMRESFRRMGRLLARAKELEPNNPRVLWVEGGDFFFKPPAYGGNQERAVQIYRRAVEVAGTPGLTDSPLPDWGKPEALMALAFAHLNQAAPDVPSADQKARAALRLQPEWSYVRDILLPQIQAAAASP